MIWVNVCAAAHLHEDYANDSYFMQGHTMTQEDRDYFRQRIAIESAMALASIGAAQQIHADMAARYKMKLSEPVEPLFDERARLKG